MNGCQFILSFVLFAVLFSFGCKRQPEVPVQEDDTAISVVVDPDAIVMEGGLYVLTDNNFFKFVKQDGVVVIDYWMTGCPPCELQAKINKELADSFAGKVKFAKIHVNRYPERAQDFNISGFPTLLVFKDGKLQGIFVGLQPKTLLESMLNKMLLPPDDSMNSVVPPA